MLAAVEAALPAEIAVMVAAVADWRVADNAPQKMKKKPGAAPAPLRLVENPDILKTVGHHHRTGDLRWSLALRPRPTMSQPMPPTSWPARAPT